MPIVKCPSCQAKYDPGLDDELKDLPGEMSMKVVCPNCGQWLRLPEQEKIDPPDVPADVLREMRSQSRLVEIVEQPRATRRDDDEDEEERPRTSRRRDEDDRPRRRGRDNDDYDAPRRGDSSEDDYDDSPRRRDSTDDDYDDYPRRKPADGLGITAMILGIVSCVMAFPAFCCALFLGVSGLTGIVAVVLGFIGRSQNPTSTTAKTGIITGFIGIALTLLLIVLMVVMQVGMRMGR